MAKIGKGTANYIIQYVDDDMVLVNNSKFEMVNVGGSDDDLLWTVCELYVLYAKFEFKYDLFIYFREAERPDTGVWLLSTRI